MRLIKRMLDKGNAKVMQGAKTRGLGLGWAKPTKWDGKEKIGVKSDENGFGTENSRQRSFESFGKSLGNNTKKFS